MNFALPAITVLLLLLPGILGVQGFLGRIGRSTSEPVAQTGLTWPWLIALLIAPPFHLALSGIVHAFGSPSPNLTAVTVLLSGEFDNADKFDDAIYSLVSHPWQLAGYITLSCAVALFLGVWLRLIIRKFKLDRKFAFLRFGNEWHYIFSGELTKDSPTPDLVIAAVTVEQGGECFLYMGVLRTFVIDPSNGNLRRLHLARAFRRNLADDRKTSEAHKQKAAPEANAEAADRYYPIVGAELVIICTEVRTINVQYIFLETT